jgi:hypothetical protein
VSTDPRSSHARRRNAFRSAGTGYGLIGILVIIVLVLVIWRLL